MANIKENLLTEGFSGKVGKQMVFHQVRNRTIVTGRAKKSTVLTERMKAQRERFKKASEYAKAQLQEPVAKAEYELLAKQLNLPSAYVAALADFLKSPVIENITAEGYTGQPGATISVSTADNYKVTGVKISILQVDGTVVENGDAVNTPGQVSWTYVTTANNATLPGTKIKAVALDRAGNKATFEIAT
jgi:hypothetical protein